MNAVKNNLKSLRSLFASYEIEGLLLTNANNIRWLSGFRGSYGRLLITHDKAILATDSRYWIQARLEAPEFELLQDKRTDEDTIALLARGEIKRIGFEAGQISWLDGQKLLAIPDYDWLPTDGIVEKLRWHKDDNELTMITAAAKVTDHVMAQVPNLVRTGITEVELAWQLEQMMRQEGASGMAFPIIVAFGPNSALPHHHPGDRQLNEDEIVLVDMGAEVQGYRSDLTRTFFYGEACEKFTSLYHLVDQAQSAAVQGIRAGAGTRDIHHLAMDIIDAQGYGDKFPHGLGHALGLDIHETPMLSSMRENVAMQSGMVFTIEPGIYLEQWGGIRIEDLVLVTETGCQPLSHCPKNPIIHPKFMPH